MPVIFLEHERIVNRTEIFKHGGWFGLINSLADLVRVTNLLGVKTP